MNFNVRFSCSRPSSVRLLCGLLAITLGLLSPVHALVGDAHDEAMDLAADKKKGFKMREDYWSGTCKPGEKKSVKMQLFKGNEYWFWLGSDEDNVDISFEIVDSSGKKIGLEATAGIAARGIRVIPPKTGSYVALFTISLKPDPPDKKSTVEKPAKICWALAYGWK